nr:Flp pilus assembly protein CpaB [Anaerolineae bacterium]
MSAGRGRRIGIIIIIVILVVIILGAAALFVMQRLGGSDDDGGVAEEPIATIEPTEVPTLDIIVAYQDIPRGKILTLEDVTTLAWPLIDEAPPPLGVLFVDDQAGGAGLDQVVGRIARMDITTGMPILNYMITEGGEPTNLTDIGGDAALLVPQNMVAIAVPITRLSSVAYALRPGDHVDILMSFRFVNLDVDFQSLLPDGALMLTDDLELAATGLQRTEYLTGREERGVFGTSLMVFPTTVTVTRDDANGESKEITVFQIPRQTTQLVIDNVIVMRMGEWPVADMYQPILVTAVPQATPVPEGEGEEEEAAGEEQGEPTPTPTAVIPIPTVITLAMSRQDALVLKYATEVGADIDLVLRSAVDDNVLDVATDPVTMDYIVNFHNVTPPANLPIALDPMITLMLDFADIYESQSTP